MKDKIMKLLVENKVDKEIATIIAETVDESFTKLQREKKLLEDEQKEVVSLVEGNLKDLRNKHSANINKVNEHWKNVFAKTKEEVTKAIEEDYKPYKEKLTTKVKNFLKENINSLRETVKVQVEEDINKGKPSEKLQQIADAVEPFFKGQDGKVIEESKELQKTLDEVSESSKKLEDELSRMKIVNRKMIDENKKLKSAIEKPLREQSSNVKIDGNKEVSEGQEDGISDKDSVIFEMRRLAEYTK